MKQVVTLVLVLLVAMLLPPARYGGRSRPGREGRYRYRAPERVVRSPQAERAPKIVRAVAR